MVDCFSEEKRSWVMSRVKGCNTKPEMIVRSMVFRMGFRFRLHRRDLPGTPDIVLPRLKKIIFVHGCFWHGHEKCSKRKRPNENQSFWNKKLNDNINRDRNNIQHLKDLGWDVLVIWEYETRNAQNLSKKLEVFLNDG